MTMPNEKTAHTPWSAEQRAQAIRDTEAMVAVSQRATAVEAYNDMAIELACQRNRLLQALQLLLKDELQAKRNEAARWGIVGTDAALEARFPDGPYDNINQARAAIALATGGKP
jgi:hypothetical protein